MVRIKWRCGCDISIRREVISYPINHSSVHFLHSYLCMCFIRIEEINKWMNVIVFVFIDENCHSEREREEK